uniref:uncharacterized protein LOC120330286 n=1 Tax=Styela clava TaxID=7725 RepID=UPI00193A6D6A|nr:uncharacterized protein LOC120330286 [Styela clava]
MKIIIFAILIVGVCGYKEKNEVNLKDFYATFDPEIFKYWATKFDFPKEKGLDFENTPECRDFKDFPHRNDSCPVPKGIGYSGDLVSDCKEIKCIQKSFYGSTKCRKKVRLFKPFPHAAVECKKMEESCKLFKPHDDKELYPKPSNDEKSGLYPEPAKDGKPHLYPEPTKDEESHLYPKPEKDEDDEEISCKCYTIWCFRDIHTIYEDGGRLYKGNIVLKTPCGCECRKPYHSPYY